MELGSVQLTSGSEGTCGGLVAGWLGFLCQDKPKPLVEARTPVASTRDVCLCSSLCVYEDVERKCVRSVPVVKQKVCSCQSYFLLGSLSDALFCKPDRFMDCCR